MTLKKFRKLSKIIKNQTKDDSSISRRACNLKDCKYQRQQFDLENSIINKSSIVGYNV